MADPSREQLAPIEEQFNSHPAIQEFLRSGSHHPLAWMRAVSKAAHDLNIQVPHDYQPTVQDGRIVLEKKSFIDRNGWFLPAVAVGAPILAGAAAGAFGGAAALPGASSTAAAGGGGGGAAATGGGAAAAGLEAGATTGLAGSGFGTGAGLGLTGVAEGFGAAGAGGGVPWGRILNRDNILGAANIASQGIGAFQNQQYLEDLAENQRIQNQLRERELAQQNEQFGANFGQRNEQFGADFGIRAKQHELEAPGKRLTTGVRGSMVANQSPVSAQWGGPGSGLYGQQVRFTGGHANPNLISKEARLLGEDVTHQALQQQLRHDDLVKYTPSPYVPTVRQPILDKPPATPPDPGHRAPSAGGTPTGDVAIPRDDSAILRPSVPGGSGSILRNNQNTGVTGDPNEVARTRMDPWGRSPGHPDYGKPPSS